MKKQELVLIVLVTILIVLNVWRIGWVESNESLHFDVSDAIPNYSPECISAMAWSNMMSVSSTPLSTLLSLLNGEEATLGGWDSKKDEGEETE